MGNTVGAGVGASVGAIVGICVGAGVGEGVVGVVAVGKALGIVDQPVASRSRRAQRSCNNGRTLTYCFSDNDDDDDSDYTGGGDHG